MKKRLTGLYRYCTVAGAVSALWSGGALASSNDVQTAQTGPQAAQAPNVEEVVVTATRIVRNGYEAPTPTSVLSPEEIQAAAKSNIADYVNDLPSVVGSDSPRNEIAGVSGGTTGINSLALRSLGPARTLVLLDGERSPASQLAGLVDVNEFPQSLISRVDVVTGGASASWGSDAVGGVVNFILDKTFTGIKGDVEGGVSTYGDDRNYKIDLTAGTGFADDRGHLLLSFQDAYQDGIRLAPRPWYNGTQTLVNPSYTATCGCPQYLIEQNVGYFTSAPGFIISSSGPLKGVYFGAGGTPAMLNVGSLASAPFMVGGDWLYTNFGQQADLDPEMARHNAFARASYDVTDAFQVYVQLSYGITRTFENEVPNFGFGNLTISANNAFLPASVKAQMTALGMTSVTGGSWNQDLGLVTGNSARQVYRYAMGADGKFDAFGSAWTWTAAAYSGHSDDYNIATTMISANYTNAINAVMGPNGVPVCASTLTNPGNGCVPYDVLGTGVASQAAKNYVLGNPTLKQFIDQRVVDTSFNGTPFSDWAGPVSVAFGGSFRRESAYGSNDPLSSTNSYFVGNYHASHGGYDVTEGFLETVVPLAENSSWAKSLEVNAAGRATYYTTSGYVTTWKVGGTYKPIDDITFRVTQSRDIRAPNLQEEFAAGLAGTSTLLDPFHNNVNTVYVGVTSGNTTLAPEKANETGLGVVVQPSFIPGLSASVDYYNINISGAISTLSAQNIVNDCYLYGGPACSEIIRNAAGSITQVNIQPINLVTLQSKGIDLETSYSTPLSAIVNDWNGKISLRFLATHFMKNYSNNGINPATNSAGVDAGSGPPSWRTTTSINYNNDPVSVTLSVKTISAGIYNNLYVQCQSNCPVSTVNNPTYNTNHIDGTFYIDSSFEYKITEDIQAYLSIANLLNRAPPAVAEGTSIGTTPIGTNPTLFDPIGRMFHMGVRFKM